MGKLIAFCVETLPAFCCVQKGWSFEQIFFSTPKSILNEKSAASLVLIFRMVGPGLTMFNHSP